jgi:DNA transformation protein and related proteins
MAVSAQFNAFVLDLLGSVTPVSGRRMFGGVGYYAAGVFFAIAHEDVLYFRVDASSRADFVAEGMPAFAPMGPGSKPMSYYAVPARLYDDGEALAVWMRRALRIAAQTAATAGSSRPRKRGAGGGDAGRLRRPGRAAKPPGSGPPGRGR